jgi:hypothetical protein
MGGNCTTLCSGEEGKEHPGKTVYSKDQVESHLAGGEVNKDLQFGNFGGQQ